MVGSGIDNLFTLGWTIAAPHKYHKKQTEQGRRAGQVGGEGWGNISKNLPKVCIFVYPK